MTKAIDAVGRDHLSAATEWLNESYEQIVKARRAVVALDLAAAADGRYRDPAKGAK